jgi:DNA-3-methyladenine glycosylase
VKKLLKSFYDRPDVVQIARELLGKIVVTCINGTVTSGMIVETEAYMGLSDKASHSFAGKRTPKNEHMYGGPGTAYIYICYGIHRMLNIVTNKKDSPDAILIRAIEPITGMDIMLKRTGKSRLDRTLTCGPGNVGKALGITKAHSGKTLLQNSLTILCDPETNIPEDKIGTSKRIGVDSAGADALLPYRFYVKGNKFVSGRPVK